jgi:hypothetical protein
MQNAKRNWDNHNCVSGTADWVWSKGEKTEPIRFSFLFTDDGSHTNWQIHQCASWPLRAMEGSRDGRQPYLILIGQLPHGCAFGVKLGHLAALARVKSIAAAELGA